MEAASADQGRIEGIFHPVICVSDMEGALRFYRDILQLRVTFDGLHDPIAIAKLFGFHAPNLRSVILECPDMSEFELVEYRHPRGRASTDREMNDAGIAALALRVCDLESLAERIASAGFTLTSGVVDQRLPDGATLKVAICRGPDNVKVILVEPPVGRKSCS